MAISDAQWERLVVAMEGIAKAMEGIAKALAGGKPAPAASTVQPNGDLPTNFPNYGRSKGAPIEGATDEDLDYYANGAKRSLADPAKARWHQNEANLLAAIEAERKRPKDMQYPPGPSAPSAGAPDDTDVPF